MYNENTAALLKHLSRPALIPFPFTIQLMQDGKTNLFHATIKASVIHWNMDHAAPTIEEALFGLARKVSMKTGVPIIFGPQHHLQTKDPSEFLNIETRLIDDVIKLLCDVSEKWAVAPDGISSECVSIILRLQSAMKNQDENPDQPNPCWNNSEASLSRFITELINERQRQDGLWGAQNHDPDRWTSIIGKQFGQFCSAVSMGRLDDSRKQLIHTAAGCAAASESIDRCFPVE